MENSIVFNTPLLLLLLFIALFICIFDVQKQTGYILPLVSILITIGTLTYATLLGASLYETATILMIFIAVNLLSSGAQNGGKE